MEGYQLTRRSLLLAFVLLWSPITANAQIATVLADAEVRLQDSFHGVIEASVGEQVVYQQAFGMADIAAGQANNGQQRFRIGSVSKTFTAAVVASFAEAGEIDLNDTISTYLDGVPNGELITLFDLLEHRSGLRDFSQADWKLLFLSDNPLTKDTVLQMIVAKKPKRKPDKKFEYNNAGYILLGYVIESVAEKGLTEVFREELFEPLELDDTGFAARDDEIHNLSVGHNKKLEADPANYDYSAIIAAGGLYSTVGDLIKWCASQSVNPERLGWRQGERFGRDAAWHTGNTNDYSALLVQFPEIDGCYAVLSNVGQKKPSKDVFRTIPAQLFGDQTEK